MDERERVLFTLAGLRVFAGLGWLAGLFSKLPPDFGGNQGGSLAAGVHAAGRHALTGLLRDVMQDPVADHLRIVGWMVFTVQGLTGLMLVVGYRTRFAAGVALAMAISAALLVGAEPGRWRWAYAMQIAISLVVLLVPAARRLSLDDRLGRDP